MNTDIQEYAGFIILVVYVVVIIFVATYAYDQGIYAGMKKLCANGELGIDKYQEIKCYSPGEIEQIKQQTIIKPNPNFDFDINFEDK